MKFPTYVYDLSCHILGSKITTIKSPIWPYKNVELNKQIEELLQKGFVRESLSTSVIHVLLTTKAHDSWRKYIDNHVINTNTVKYRFLIPRVDEILNLIVGAQWFHKIDLDNG